MERYTVLLNGKNQYCLKDYITPGNLQIQYNPSQIIKCMHFTKLRQIIPKSVWNYKRLQIIKIILRKKKKSGGLMIPDFKLCCKAAVIKSTVLAEKWIRRLMEKETATHSSVLAWRIPGTGEPGGLPSMGSHRVGHDWGDLAAAADQWNRIECP